jgi:hypothetical protein
VWSATVDTDDTANRIAALGDSRIRFLNLPFRSTYPEGPTDRWLVSEVMPYDRAVELCGGSGSHRWTTTTSSYPDTSKSCSSWRSSDEPSSCTARLSR